VPHFVLVIFIISQLVLAFINLPRLIQPHPVSVCFIQLVLVILGMPQIVIASLIKPQLVLASLSRPRLVLFSLSQATARLSQPQPSLSYPFSTSLRSLVLASLLQLVLDGLSLPQLVLASLSLS
jgi:hypothetical protein